jgi:1,4-alpha-glucan branching enzyme
MEINNKNQSSSENGQAGPNAVPAVTSDYDLHLFGQGKHHRAWNFMGARPHRLGETGGAVFTVWAPNARRVSVVGDFNGWNGANHGMRPLGSSGVWELFVAGDLVGDLYKFEVDTGHRVVAKADPYGKLFEFRPSTASRVVERSTFEWQDGEWLQKRAASDWLHRPLSIYEVHAGSWQRRDNGDFLDYRELAERLIPHVSELGFTHIELLPVTEHPFDGSWGYQTTGYFAPTSRFGTPDDLRYFVDQCHRHNLGVILDWVPGHFPRDDHALARFDGTALYEHDDPRLGEHKDWGTLIFNYDRNEVRCFLLSSALYWLDEFHMDGLRIDAVASMLYLDYSRDEGEWLPNRYGGRENLEAIEFLRELNELTHAYFPGTYTCAEESTSWPMVSRPTYVGGLGFSMKWNMGWMHDTLLYIGKDPVHRHYHHNNLTFGMLYAYTENFVLPFSHDEVVHGKGSMIGKMPGDEWQKFANLRLLYTYQFTYPGKKLNFMGNEFAQWREWDFGRPLDWDDATSENSVGVQRLVGDLNRLYSACQALHLHDFEPDGFDWIDCNDAAQSVLSYLRKGGGQIIVVVLNFTPVPRHNYRVGVPQQGFYREILNSDSAYYRGSDMGNGGGIQSEAKPWMGRSCSLSVTLPPLAGIVLELSR